MKVIGTYKAPSGAERYIIVNSISGPTGGTDPILSLGMNNRFAGTALAGALYVKIWGIAAIGLPGDYTITDGTGTPIRVIGAPTVGNGVFTDVKGVLSIGTGGPVLYQRN